jgi:hypothetical protein
MRGHYNKAMSVWLTVSGIHGGMVHRATDDLGCAAVDKFAATHDLASKAAN